MDDGLWGCVQDSGPLGYICDLILLVQAPSMEGTGLDGRSHISEGALRRRFEPGRIEPSDI